MTTLHACAFVALSALAVACGGGDSDNKPDALIVLPPDAAPDAPPPPPDAPSFDFSCMNNPAPDAAAATVSMSGTAQDLNVVAMQLEPVEGAVVTATKNPNTPVGIPTTSDMQGNWTVAGIVTGGTPVDGFVEATKTGHRTTRIYPPEPLTADQAGIPIPLLSNQTFGIVVQFAQAQQSDANGTVGLAVIDCAGTPVSGATISVTQGGNEVGTQFDISQLQPGAFLIFDVPPGDTVVDATINGTSLREHTITVVAQTTSGTIVTPGFAN